MLKYNIVFKNCNLKHQIRVNVQYVDAYLMCIYDPHIKEEVGTLFKCSDESKFILQLIFGYSCVECQFQTVILSCEFSLIGGIF